jgi:hypothetical protein
MALIVLSGNPSSTVRSVRMYLEVTGESGGDIAQAAVEISQSSQTTQIHRRRATGESFDAERTSRNIRFRTQMDLACLCARSSSGFARTGLCEHLKNILDNQSAHSSKEP